MQGTNYAPGMAPPQTFSPAPQQGFPAPQQQMAPQQAPVQSQPPAPAQPQQFQQTPTNTDEGDFNSIFGTPGDDNF